MTTPQRQRLHITNRQTLGGTSRWSTCRDEDRDRMISAGQQRRALLRACRGLRRFRGQLRCRVGLAMVGVGVQDGVVRLDRSDTWDGPHHREDVG